MSDTPTPSALTPPQTEPEKTRIRFPAISWSRVLIEGVVIVTSILLAFGIDAAWEARQKAQQREALLAALAGDMVHARAEIERVANFHRRAREAAGVLLSTESFREDQSAQVDSLLATTWGSTASYDAPLDAIESVVSAGGLDLLSNPDLAFELLAFPALVADLDREQVKLQRYCDELQTYLGTQGIDVSRLHLPWFEAPWETGPTESIGLVEDAHFRTLVGVIWRKYTATTNIFEEMDLTIGRIDSLLTAP